MVTKGNQVWALAAVLASAALLVVNIAQASAPARTPARTSPLLTFIADAQTPKPSVEVANLNGSDPRRLGPGMTALVSPSGRSVAVVELVGPSSNTSSELLVYPSGGGAPKKLYRGGGFLDLIGWSENSTRLLAWSAGAEDSGPLLEIDVASGAATKLASGVIEGASFAPNSSGDVVFALAKSLLDTAPVNIFVNLPSGGPALQLTSDGHDSNPLWGPRSIVFARSTSRGSQYAPINQLWSIAPSGGRATQLTRMSVGNLVEGLVPAAFSANGEHLLAEFEGTDTAAIWAVDLASSHVKPRALLGDDGSVADGISRNGDTVLFTQGFEGAPTSVRTISWSGGKTTVLAAHGANASWNG
jgi:hypothetical protein